MSGEREIPAEDSIKVVCRFRPLNDSEEKAGSKFIVKFPSGGEDNCISIAEFSSLKAGFFVKDGFCSNITLINWELESKLIQARDYIFAEENILQCNKNFRYFITECLNKHSS
ncbi:hypothetical protein WA026_015963 [Henosepilachna vigintioctopunctata]|uniref:Kinesin motor domain-containing protein n=1 Tax=Henosepilachna vigintioctopunctata TaxID=420089 RepID=A0AAW1UCD3_9CUCU